MEFLDLASIPVLDGPVVAGDAGVDLSLFAADGALPLLAGDVAMVGADRIGRRHGVIGELVVLRDLPDELHAGFPVREALAKEGVEDGAGGVEGLELILDVEGREDVIGESDREVRGVGVIRGLAVFGGGDDVGVTLLVVLGKTECGGFGRGGLEVIEVAVFLLIIGEFFPHVVEDFDGEFLRFPMGEVGLKPTGV